MQQVADDALNLAKKFNSNMKHTTCLYILSAMTVFPEKFLNLDQNEKTIHDLVKKSYSNSKIHQAFDPFFLVKTQRKITKTQKLATKMLREF